jgi:hypothetical protein
LDDYLTKVFPNPNLRNYFLDFFASCLYSGNVHKRFLIGTGGGDNAKTATFRLLELTFGMDVGWRKGYYGKFPRSAMVQATASTGSSAPREDLEHAIGKKVMSSDELTKDEKFNIGFIKQITGGEAQHIRGMYSKRGRDIRVTYTLGLQGNEPPQCPGDDAYWERARILDFESKFVKPQNLYKWPVPKTFEEQFKMKRFYADPLFNKKLPDLAPVLLWKLFQRYNNEYRKYGLVEPEEVLTSTQKYRDKYDAYSSFIMDKIEKVEDEDEVTKSYIRREDMMLEFKSWFVKNFPSLRKEGDTTVKEEMIKRLGIKSEGEYYGWGRLNRFWGYRIKYEDDTSDRQGTDAQLYAKSRIGTLNMKTSSKTRVKS